MLIWFVCFGFEFILTKIEYKFTCRCRTKGFAGIFEYANGTIYLYFVAPITFAHHCQGSQMVWMPCVPYLWINLCESIFFVLFGVLQGQCDIRREKNQIFFFDDKMSTHFFRCCADIFFFSCHSLCRFDALCRSEATWLGKKHENEYISASHSHTSAYVCFEF